MSLGIGIGIGSGEDEDDHENDGHRAKPTSHKETTLGAVGVCSQERLGVLIIWCSGANLSGGQTSE